MIGQKRKIGAKMRYIGAIFDQDGLLFDTEKIFQAAWLEAGKEQGVEVEPLFPRQFCGKPVSAIAELTRKNYPMLDVDLYCKRAVETSWSIQLSGVPEKKPGLMEMLGFCRKNGILTAVASSSCRRVVEHNLEAAGVREFFDAVVCGEEVANGKPAPDIFLLAARKIGLNAADCCVFEDAISGITGALRAGCRAVMIPDTVAPNDEIISKCLVYNNLAEATRAFS